MGYSISSREIKKRLRKDGWTKTSQNGDHENYRKPGCPLIITITHPRRDFPVGTLRNIWNAAGWDWPPR